jgi:transposase
MVDNYATHNHQQVQAWRARHPRVYLHFTPTYSSWLNLVERWFAELSSKWLRRGTHRSVAELQQSIQSWIDTWNDNPRPFVWTRTADEILDTIAAYCQRINDLGH